jgi:hypothetical protein
MTPGALANKKYRKKYPERRNPERQRNYASTAGPEKNYSHKALWTILELTFINLNHFTDRELHTILGRSVAAIQNKRWKIRKETLND